ncbi:hypothetical protein L1987_37037 [Smallanthus sonchifolius]|uniref:Uncharacterized protein n=1 Tax=Smallanthus sonchifolius TaxID=185202 RepID=A0ACB9HFX3_9ASTR|nr:hypothetical protein L1987_37037 [Smallanthus sonchifolius]
MDTTLQPDFRYGFETTTDHVQSHDGDGFDGDGFDGEDSGGEDHVDATTHYESNDTSMPVDNSRKPLITVVGRKFGDIKVHKAIGVMFSRSFDASWTTYRHVPRATVGIVHDLFRDTYTFDPTVDSEHSIRVAFENVLKDHM